MKLTYDEEELGNMTKACMKVGYKKALDEIEEWVDEYDVFSKCALKNKINSMREKK